MWRSLRISILLLILLAAGGSALLDRFQAADWDDTLTVGIFPVNADGRPATSAYLAGLDRQSFVPLEEFFAREALRYSVQRVAPVQVRLQGFMLAGQI